MAKKVPTQFEQAAHAGLCNECIDMGRKRITHTEIKPEFSMQGCGISISFYAKVILRTAKTVGASFAQLMSVYFMRRGLCLFYRAWAWPYLFAISMLTANAFPPQMDTDSHS